MADLFSALTERAKNVKNKTLVFPEGEDERIIKAATRIANEGLCKVIILGEGEELEALKSDVIKIINPKEETEESARLAEGLYEIRKNKGLTLDDAKKLVKEGIYYSCMMLSMGLADGVVAGARLHSATVMRAAFQIIKGSKETPLVSSCFIMEVPENKRETLGENGFMVFSDCAVCTYPNSKELAYIALASTKTAKNILGLEPKVSFLSYSTAAKKTEDETILKVKQAVEEFKTLSPETLVEGEVQLDAAVRPEVSALKNPESPVKGKANVLVFPDINAGNIGYKLASNFGSSRAIGPILQGLNKPVNDLSRGATEEEVYLTAVITLLQSNN